MKPQTYNRSSVTAAEHPPEDKKLREKMTRIRHKIVVMSGKGGVGKSTVAVNLASSLFQQGLRVGLLDIDLHGPSIPVMLGMEATPVPVEDGDMIPADLGGLKVMSIGFMLKERDEAVIWRGPRKAGVIKQFLQDVAWGELDYLIIDAPPGTGDEPLAVCEYIGEVDGTVIVTTPQDVAAADVRKSITFCRRLNIPVLGVVENMSGFVCPTCNKTHPIFGQGGGEKLASDMEVPFLGTIPLHPQIAEGCDKARPYMMNMEEPISKAMEKIIQPILALQKEACDESQAPGKLRLALPVVEGTLSAHFGHCEKFVFFDVNPNNKVILKQEQSDAPPHQPGFLPGWLAEQGVNIIIAGGMGQRAQELFAQHGIQVVVGARPDKPEHLVAAYLEDHLLTGENLCDH